MPPLLAVPNVSEGSDAERLERLEQAFTRGVSLLDRHSDADHGRSVFTLAGGPGALAEALATGAEEVARYVREVSEADAKEIGEAARRRAVSAHSYARRAELLDALLKVPPTATVSGVRAMGWPRGEMRSVT